LVGYVFDIVSIASSQAVAQLQCLPVAMQAENRLTLSQYLANMKWIFVAKNSPFSDPRRCDDRQLL
jgi:hypothetical protein